MPDAESAANESSAVPVPSVDPETDFAGCAVERCNCASSSAILACCASRAARWAFQFLSHFRQARARPQRGLESLRLPWAPQWRRHPASRQAPCLFQRRPPMRLRAIEQNREKAKVNDRCQIKPVFGTSQSPVFVWRQTSRRLVSWQLVRLSSPGRGGIRLAETLLAYMTILIS